MENENGKVNTDAEKRKRMMKYIGNTEQDLIDSMKEVNEEFHTIEEWKKIDADREYNHSWGMCAICDTEPIEVEFLPSSDGGMKIQIVK